MKVTVWGRVPKCFGCGQKGHIRKTYFLGLQLEAQKEIRRRPVWKGRKMGDRERRTIYFKDYGMEEEATNGNGGRRGMHHGRSNTVDYFYKGKLL